MSILASSEISIFYIVSVAEDICSSVALLETPKTGAHTMIRTSNVWYSL